MRKILFFGLLMFASAVLAQSRADEVPRAEALGAVVAADSLAELSDSARLAHLQTLLAEARLAEAGLKMEVEQLRVPLAADSAQRAAARRRIDSLRQVTGGCPVVVEGDTLFSIYAKRGGHTPAARAEMDAAAITELGKQLTMVPDSLYVEHSEIASDLMYGEQVLVTFTDGDGLWENTTRQHLADSVRVRVVEKLRVMHEVYGWIELAKRVGLFVLLVVGQWALIRLTNWLFRKARRRICRRRVNLKSVRIQNYELFDAYKQVRMMLFASNIARYVVILLQLVISVPLLFAIFPHTRTLAYEIISYIWTPLRNILLGVVDYIPNLFTIAVIWVVTRYAVKGMRYLAMEIHDEKLTIKGFYPDWAI